VPHGPVDGADPRRAEADDLDDAGRLAQVDGVADAVLVLDEDEDAREEVADETLRPEAQRDPDIDFVVGTPLTIGGILLSAAIVNRLARRAIRRGLRRLASVGRLVDPPAEHPRLVAAGVLDLAR
jgi:hypothetical protein